MMHRRFYAQRRASPALRPRHAPIWRKPFAHALGMFGMACAQAGLAQSASDDRWMFGAQHGLIMTDQNWRGDGQFTALQIGRTFGPRYAFELELMQDQLDFGIDYGLKHRSVALNHLTINREPLWDPYFLVGIGMIEFDAPDLVAEQQGNDFMFNLGIGGQWELVLPEKLFLRADFRLRYDLNDTRQPGQNGFGDGLISIGLFFPFNP